MENWDSFRFFLALARHKTLKSAPRHLNVDQTTVGRQIQQLQEILGTQVFEKSSNGFHLTVAGQRILPILEEMETAAHSAERKIVGLDENPNGTLRIALPGALANHWLIPHLSTFRKNFPKIHLELLTGPEVLNLSRREADIAIRLVRPTEQDLVLKRKKGFSLGLYGHKTLFRSKSKPQKIEDLSNWPFVGLYPWATSDAEAGILRKIKTSHQPALTSAAWSSVFYSVQGGLGLGILPSFLAMRDPSLERISFVDPTYVPLWIVNHPDLSKSHKVRLFLDFIDSIDMDD